MTDIDFPALIEPVARRLWGDPVKGLSTKLSLRWGSKGSRSVQLDGQGFWHDFETGESGGVLKLVMQEVACDQAGAVEWLQNEGFIEARPDRQPRQETEDRSEPPDGPGEDPGPQEGQKSKRVAVKGYHYTNGDGELLYDVVRYQWQLPDGSWELDKKGNVKKTFSQRRPDGAGGYIPNMDGVEHTLYHLPALQMAIAAGSPIYIPEGEKDVETLEAWDLAATTNSGGANGWTQHLTQHFKDADVVILVDNDTPGRNLGEVKAKSLKGIARRIRVLDLATFVPNLKEKGDVTDWRNAGGTKEQFLAWVEQLPDWRPRPPQSKFRAVRMHELGRKDLQHEYLVADMLERKGIAAVAGESQGGKSFITVALAGSIAAGLKFWGRDVKQGLVLYQAGEGEKGLSKRLTAWMQQYEIGDQERLPFVLLPRKINLFVDDKDMEALISEAREWEEFYGQKTRLVVIDTWNKAARGANEISGQDVGRVLERMEKMSEELDCLVIFVHHMNAAGGKMRGHTSLLDDLNNVLLIKRLEISDQNGRILRTMVLDKNKDGERGAAQRFVLRKVLMEPVDGKEVSTCVVDYPAGSDEEKLEGYRLTDSERTVYQALVNALGEFGEAVPYELRLPASVGQVVQNRFWKEAVKKVWPFKEVDSDTLEQREARQNAELTALMKRTALNLFNAGVIGRDNNKAIVWRTGKEVRGFRKRKVDQPSLTREIAEAEVPF